MARALARLVSVRFVAQQVAGLAVQGAAELADHRPAEGSAGGRHQLVDRVQADTGVFGDSVRGWFAVCALICACKVGQVVT
jgi:hypothetical protein